MLRLASIVIVISAAFTGCATARPVVRLHPTARDPVWHSGRAIVARQASDLRVAVAYDRSTEDSHVLRVELQNLGHTPREVGPQRMVYRTCPVPRACRVRQPVMDPEATLLALDQAHARTRASQANHDGVGAALLMLNLVATVGAVAQGKGHEAAHLASGGLQIADSTQATHDRKDSEMAAIEVQRSNWASAALRRTTLGPGQGIAGFVQVPLEMDARQVWLGVNADGPMIWFEFEQLVIVSP